ncbi:DUF2490 domain-containing protein [bacterium SCSIO 12741]|nr:DUF2490 domain-containing protein [bacterium SCSIO 12741]
MMKWLVPLVIIGWLMALPSSSWSQAQNDYELWTGAIVSGKVKKKLKLTGKYQVRFKNNASQLRSQYLQGAIRYKFAKYYLLGANYRLSDFEETLVVHRFDINNYFRLPIQKNFFEFRFKYQLSFPQAGPNFQRYRFRLRYVHKINKKLRIYGKIQYFYTVSNSYSAWNRQRYVAGGRIRIFKKNYLDLFLQYDRQMNIESPVQRFVTGVNYMLSF